MKNLKSLFTLMCCALLATVSFTSCLGSNSNDDSGHYKQLTQADKTMMITALAGNYTGKIYYYKNASAEKPDSSVVTITAMTDSTVTISNISTEVISNYTPGDEATVQGPKSFAVKANVRTPMSTYTKFFNEAYYVFEMTPITTKFTVGGKTVTIEYLSSLVYKNTKYDAICIAYKNQFSGYLLIKSITVDNKVHDVNLPLLVSGKK